MKDESRPDMAPSAEQADFRLTIKRNCSISPRQLALLLGATAAVSFGIGIGFAVLGAWVILPFAGLEIAGLAAAFCCVGRHAGDYEKFELGQGRLKVEIRDADTVSAHEFNPHWARLVVEPGAPEPRIALRSHGRMLEIGRHLPARERLGLAQRLQDQLSSYQKG
jgi:uncharacterized membrane protein